MKSSRTISTKAFTLVELLAVIAIVGVLAAIVISATGRVRDRAEAGRCMTALRSLGTTTGLYAADNRNAFPPIHAKGFSQTYWRRAYLAYQNLPNDAANYLTSLSQTPFTCGAVGKQLAEANLSPSFIAYSMNDDLHGARMNAIRNPARTFLAVDATMKTGNLPNESATPRLVTDYGHDYHSGGANLLFVDGHVERFETIARIAEAPYGRGGDQDMWTP